MFDHDDLLFPLQTTRNSVWFEQLFFWSFAIHRFFFNRIHQMSFGIVFLFICRYLEMTTKINIKTFIVSEQKNFFSFRYFYSHFYFEVDILFHWIDRVKYKSNMDVSHVYLLLVQSLERICNIRDLHHGYYIVWTKQWILSNANNFNSKSLVSFFRWSFHNASRCFSRFVSDGRRDKVRFDRSGCDIWEC